MASPSRPSTYYAGPQGNIFETIAGGIKAGVGFIESLFGGGDEEVTLPVPPPNTMPPMPGYQMPQVPTMPQMGQQVPMVRQPGMIYPTSGPPPGPGFRPNKSRYFRRAPNGQVVEILPGQVWVKRRRRNSTNVRALRRALSRVEGFTRVERRVQKSIRKTATAAGVNRRRRAPRRAAPKC